MVLKTLTPPVDVAAVEAQLEAQRHHYEALLAQRDAVIEASQSTIEQLHEQIHVLLSRRFGASAEKVCDGQLGLFNEAEVSAEQDEPDDSPPAYSQVAPHRRKVAKRRPLPEHLRRVEVVHELPEQARVCPHDGTALKVMGEKTSEQLNVVPMQLFVERHRRLTYSCPCCREYIVTAPVPAQPIPKSFASAGLLAYIATAKFVDGLPLYRQSKQFERIGIELSRATMAGWMLNSAKGVQPLINLLRETMLSLDYVHMDETTVQVLKESGRAPESKSYLWAQYADNAGRPIVLFDYTPGRGGEVPIELLDGFTGTLHTDGYAGYGPVVRQNGLTHLHCWAHARRALVDVIKAAGINPNKLPPKPPDKIRRPLKGLGYIRTLYTIERRIKNLTPEQRYRVRQDECLPVLAKLRAWITQLRPKVAPKSELGKALGYLHNQWDGLAACFDDGRYQIDNNRVENAIRPFCVGRKNWLFSDTPAGAKASANLYALIETAKANKLEPYAYLRHVFAALPTAQCVDDIEALLPWNIDSKAITPQNN